MPASMADGEVAAVVVSAGEVDVVADEVDCPVEPGAVVLPHAASATARAMLTGPATRARHAGLVSCPIRSSRAVSTGTPKKSCHHIDVPGRKAVDRNSPGRLRIVRSPANPTVSDLTGNWYMRLVGEPNLKYRFLVATTRVARSGAQSTAGGGRAHLSIRVPRCSRRERPERSRGAGWRVPVPLRPLDG